MSDDFAVEVRGATELRLKLGDIGDALDNTVVLMGQIGAKLNTMIKARTAEGIDAAGDTFDPYSPSYKLWREKAGYPTGLTNTVDLTLTGGMMAAMTYEAANDIVTSFFMDTADKRNPNVRNPEKAFFNQELRNFFSIGADEVVEIEDLVTDYINAELRSDQRGTK